MPRIRYALCLEEWPAADRQAWRAAAQDGPLFGDAGRACHWAPITRAQVEKGYGMWLNFLAWRGELDQEAAPSARAIPSRVIDYIRELETRLAPVSVASRLRDLVEAIRVMDPTGDRGPVVRALRRRERTARPSRDKHAGLVAPTDLYEAGLGRMDREDAAAEGDRALRALRYSDGLRMAMLAAKPVRLRNLVGTQLGLNLIKAGARYVWQFGPHETKTAEAIRAAMPERLTPYIDRWLEHHRALLLAGGQADALWLTYRGTAMGRAAVYERFCSATEHELGVRINPQAVRHIVATGVAIALPEAVQMTPYLLDHRSDRTSTEHYNLADGLSASARYLRCLEMRRQRALNGDRSER
jgi:integrase/recombinase XerD